MKSRVHLRRPRQFRLTDSAQQTVGGFLLAGPFVVTEEVWVLAANMTAVHAAATTAIVFAVGYAALYKADASRDPEVERDVGGVPLRFVSLMIVSFGSVAVLATVLSAPDAFLVDAELAGEPTRSIVVLTTFKAISVGAIFSVVGAATADSVF